MKWTSNNLVHKVLDMFWRIRDGLCDFVEVYVIELMLDLDTHCDGCDLWYAMEVILNDAVQRPRESLGFLSEPPI